MPTCLCNASHNAMCNFLTEKNFGAQPPSCFVRDERTDAAFFKFPSFRKTHCGKQLLENKQTTHSLFRQMPVQKMQEGKRTSGLCRCTLTPGSAASVSSNVQLPSVALSRRRLLLKLSRSSSLLPSALLLLPADSVWRKDGRKKGRKERLSGVCPALNLSFLSSCLSVCSSPAQ